VGFYVAYEVLLVIVKFFKSYLLCYRFKGYERNLERWRCTHNKRRNIRKNASDNKELLPAEMKNSKLSVDSVDTVSSSSSSVIFPSAASSEAHTVRNPSLALESQTSPKEREHDSSSNVKMVDMKQKENPPSSTSSSSSASTGDISKLLLDQSRRAKVPGSEGVWDTVSTDMKDQINDIATQQKRNDQLISRKNQVSQWDRMLDSGKNKKIKNKSKYDKYPYNNGKNKFQEFVNYKGFHTPKEY
jgi:hypothetical protein